MRVVFLTHNYPRHAGDLPGSFLHPLAVALRARGVDLRVVAPSDAGQGGEDVLDGVPVRRVRYAAPTRERYANSGRMLDALGSPAGLLALRSLSRNLRRAARDAAAGADGAVVHAHWWFPAGQAAPPDLPMVLTSHGTDVRLLERWMPARILARPVYRRARIVTAVSSHLARVISRTTGRPVGPDAVQPMPVSTEGWPWSSGGGGLLIVARLTSQKRVHLAIDALARGRPSLTCTIIGDGPERPGLQQRAAALGLGGRLRFLGALPFPEVLRHLAVADLAVLPARQEGLGLALAEALMCGVPIVLCRDGGGLLDLAEPGASRVAEPDAGSIAVAVDELLAAPDARQAARTAGAAWRERLAPATVAARFESWYRQALDA